MEAERSLTRRLGAWVRVGADNGAVEPVSGYLGAGFVLKTPFAGHPDDSVGLAVAHALNRSEVRRLKGVEAAETGLELIYQFKLSTLLSAQPDFQYVFDPSLDRRFRNVAALGVRLIASLGLPKPAPATDPSDPTVQPADRHHLLTKIKNPIDYGVVSDASQPPS